MSDSIAKPVPHRLVLALCWLFAILYGVWILPETVFIRHFCLVVGAVLSLYVIYPNRTLLLQKKALPIWLILGLIVWVTVHLFFFSHDFERQLNEYTKIWKKVFIGAVFAIGLGLALISQIQDKTKTKQYWKIIYFGFMLPMLAYFIKYLITKYAPQFDYVVPKYLIHSTDAISSPLGISRAFYVFYCLPAFAISIDIIAHSIREKNIFSIKTGLVHLIIPPLTLLIFYIEGDRFGIIFSALLILFLFGVIFLTLIKKKAFNLQIGLMPLLMLVISVIIVTKSFQSNEKWKTVVADAKLAVQVEKYDAWKYNRQTNPGYPINEMGIPASDSNYMRIAWATVGAYLLYENPIGYGLLSLSFGELSREKWPDAETSWSHSAWLDFALGYGMPGAALLLAAAVLAIVYGIFLPYPWRPLGFRVLMITSFVLIAKELSTEVIINCYIFLIAWVSAMNVGYAERQKSADKKIIY